MKHSELVGVHRIWSGRAQKTCSVFFFLFSAGSVPELGLLGEEGNRTRKQRMWNKRMWPSHVFTSFARSSINTFVSEALDLEENKTQNTHWGEGIPGMTRRQQTHSALGGMEKGGKKSLSYAEGE